MNNLMQTIGYTFRNLELLKNALTHISYSNETGETCYDRLEFLGDAVIELVVSDYIYKFTELDSGVLSKLRASLVSTKNLAQISQSLHLDNLVKKSKSLPTLSQKNLADLFESLVGAVYLDGGMESAEKLVKKYVIVDLHNTMQNVKNCVDFKTKLQEDMQSKKYNFEYVLVGSMGKDHDKTFDVELLINDKVVSRGEGKSIQLAEENCAKNYYENK